MGPEQSPQTAPRWCRTQILRTPDIATESCTSIGTAKCHHRLTNRIRVHPDEAEDRALAVEPVAEETEAVEGMGAVEGTEVAGEMEGVVETEAVVVAVVGATQQSNAVKPPCVGRIFQVCLMLNLTAHCVAPF